VRDGPRVRLPHRDYLLYQGPAEAVVTLAGLDGAWGQSPNIWWPADRAWCVATAIDLPWTYVGGPRGLIDAILAEDRIEALPAALDDPVSRTEDWVTAWAGQLADGLMARGAASLTTPRGSVDAWLRRPHRIGKGNCASRSPGTVTVAAALAWASAGATRSSGARYANASLPQCSASPGCNQEATSH
jgi:hypothetical protein